MWCGACFRVESLLPSLPSSVPAWSMRTRWSTHAPLDQVSSWMARVEETIDSMQREMGPAVAAEAHVRLEGECVPMQCEAGSFLTWRWRVIALHWCAVCSALEKKRQKKLQRARAQAAAATK